MPVVVTDVGYIKHPAHLLYRVLSPAIPYDLVF